MNELRKDDPAGPGDAADFTLVEDPWALFRTWMAEAERAEPVDPNAMAVATAGADGLPDVRVVLLKGVDARGFVFYSNVESAKGVELGENPQAALVFHWKSLRRQIRARGAVTRVSDAEADAYYRSRPRDSRIGAWASRQSRPLADRATFEAAIGEADARHPGEDVPRPPYWTGFRIAPASLEFWQDRPFRLHDRVRFTRAGEGWARARLYP